MIFVALTQAGIIGFLLIIHFALIAVMRGQNRQHDRRVDMLLDRLAHAEGRTWTPPPAETNHDEPIAASYATFPEQEPEN